MSDTEGAVKPASRGGRPSKGGGSGTIPVNVRLATEDHDVLSDLATEIKVSGRPIPSVQDVIRRLIRGAIADPETLRRLVDDGQLQG